MTKHKLHNEGYTSYDEYYETIIENPQTAHLLISELTDNQRHQLLNTITAKVEDEEISLSHAESLKSLI